MVDSKRKGLGLLGRLLPIIGGALMLGAFAWAMHIERFDAIAAAMGVGGLLLFMTLFIRVELANLKFYLYSLSYAAVVFCLCGLVYLFAERYPQRFDFSEAKLGSLTPETLQYLGQIDGDVAITIFHADLDQFKPVAELYREASPNVRWELFNAEQSPDVARSFGEAVRNGDIFIRSGEQEVKLNSVEIGEWQDTAGKSHLKKQNMERFFTSGIWRVWNPDPVKIYFLEGHGEVSFDPQPESEQRRAGASLALFRQFLEGRAMQTARLDLGSADAVPEDADLVVIAGPVSDLYEGELDKLRNYIDAKGNLLFLVRGFVEKEYLDQFDRTTAFLEELGVFLSNQVVLDNTSAAYGLKVYAPMLQYFNGNHPIARELVGGVRSNMLSMCRVLYADPSREDLDFAPLVSSSKESWSENLKLVAMKLARRQQIAPPEDQELKPYPLALAISPSAPPAIPGLPPTPAATAPRVVVMGDSSFIRDQFLTQSPVGAELMLNTIKWLTEQEQTIAVPEKIVEGTQIILTPAASRVILIFIGLLLPAVIFFGGVSYALLRRRA